MPYLDTTDQAYGLGFAESQFAPPPALDPDDPETKRRKLMALLQGTAGLGGPPPPQTPPPPAPTPIRSPDDISRSLDRLTSTPPPSRPVKRPDLGMGAYSDDSGVHTMSKLKKAFGVIDTGIAGLGGGLRGAHQMQEQYFGDPLSEATKQYSNQIGDRQKQITELQEAARLRDQMTTSAQNRQQGAETHTASLGSMTPAGTDIPGVGHIPGTTEQDARHASSAANTTEATTLAAGRANLKLQLETAPQTIKNLIEATKAKLAAASITPDNPMYNAEMAKALGLTPQLMLGDVMEMMGQKNVPDNLKNVPIDAKTAADIISKQIDAKIAASGKVSAAEIAAGVAGGMMAGNGAGGLGPGESFGPKVAAGEMKITEVPMKQRKLVSDWLTVNSANIPKQLSSQGKQVISSITLAKPIVDDLLAELEPHKTRGGTLTELKKRMQSEGSWVRYKMGLGAEDTPEAKMNDDITQLMSFMNIATIGQYLRGIRRYEFVKQVQQHLPQPGFTPAANYQRLLGLKNNVLPQLERAIMESEQKSVTGGHMGGPAPAAASTLTPSTAPKLAGRYNPATGTIDPP